MDFLKISYETLEIYKKDERPTSFEEDYINNNSEFLTIAKIILEENPDILSVGDLNTFIDKIKKTFSEYSEIIKKNPKINNDSNALKEFDECFSDDNTINKLNNFVTKYEFDEDNLKLLAVLFNLITIIDYIILKIKEPELYNVAKFVVATNEPDEPDKPDKPDETN